MIPPNFFGKEVSQKISLRSNSKSNFVNRKQMEYCYIGALGMKQFDSQDFFRWIQNLIELKNRSFTLHCYSELVKGPFEINDDVNNDCPHLTLAFKFFFFFSVPLIPGSYAGKYLWFLAKSLLQGLFVKSRIVSSRELTYIQPWQP